MTRLWTLVLRDNLITACKTMIAESEDDGDCSAEEAIKEICKLPTMHREAGYYQALSRRGKKRLLSDIGRS